MSDRAKVIEELRRRIELFAELGSVKSAELLTEAAAQIEADGRLQAEYRALAEKYEAEDKRVDGEMKAMEAVNASLCEQIEQGQAGRVAMVERAWQQDRRVEALEATFREIAVPLHDLAGNASLMRKIARKALAIEPAGCPTPGACSCPGAGDVVSGRLEWRGNELYIGSMHAASISQALSDKPWAVWNWMPMEMLGSIFPTESEARAVVEQAVRAAIAGGKPVETEK